MYDIDPLMSWIHENDNEEKQIRGGREDWSLSVFFATRAPERIDISAGDDVPLFSRAVEKFGPLVPDEMFGFKPALALGGPRKLENVTKVDIHVHLDLLAQLGHREIVDRKSLTKKAFGG